MSTPRRGLLLGLGFTLEALREAGLSDTDLAAPAHAELSQFGGSPTEIYDIELEQTRQMIDVTTFADSERQFIPGLQRATVKFKVSMVAAQSWHRAIMDGEPVQFSERVGGVRLTCMLRVTDIIDSAAVDGPYVCTVHAQVVGEPVIEQDAEPVAPPATAVRTVPQGRRGMKLKGELLID